MFFFLFWVVVFLSCFLLTYCLGDWEFVSLGEGGGGVCEILEFRSSVVFLSSSGEDVDSSLLARGRVLQGFRTHFAD